MVRVLCQLLALNGRAGDTFECLLSREDQTTMAQSEPFRFDPTETSAAQDFCSAKALFVLSLKRDIVLCIACTRPPAGGVAWQSIFDGENSYSHWAARRLRFIGCLWR